MAASDALVVLYSRSTCPLCDDARDTVERVCRDVGATWTEILIDDSPSLIAAFGEYVPVVEVGGVQQGFWHIDSQRLRRAVERSQPGG